MFKVHIIYSPTKDKFYVGFTGDDIDNRIRKHNTNHKGFTGGIGDWLLKHMEKFDSKTEAMFRERQIQSWKTRALIEKPIIGIE